VQSHVSLLTWGEKCLEPAILTINAFGLRRFIAAFVWSPTILIAASRTNPHLLGRAAKRPVPKAAINRRTPKLLKAAINRRSPKAARNTSRADYTRKTTQPRMALAQGKALYGGGPGLWVATLPR
jgi:hypothetical protein